MTAEVLKYLIDGDKLSLTLKGEEKFVATYKIQSEAEKEKLEKELKIGYTLHLFGEEATILPATIPNTFSYKDYLYHQKIYFVFTISSFEIVDTNFSFFDSFKNKVDERLKRIGNNAYLRAFILGDKSEIESQEFQTIVDNGVSHLFALSGMHLSFLYAILSKLLFKIKWKKFFIYLFFFFYLILTSFSVSFLRAVLFFLFIDLNKKFHFGISNMKILFLIAFLFLLLNPFYIYQIGFWYTFVVTFSLLFCKDIIHNHHPFLQIFFVSLITFFFSAPITIFSNYEINLFSIVNNVILVPFISSIVFPIAILTFIIPFLLPILNFLLLLLEKINVFCSYFSCFLIFGKISILDCIFYYIFLLLFIKFRLKKILFCFLFFLLFLYNKNIFETSYSVYFLDVGQGDSTLFIAPQNKETILIDTGGVIQYSKKEYQIRKKEFNLAENIILFLKSKRIRHLDLLLLTHGDLDHLGYSKEIGKAIKIKKVMINQGKINSYEQELIERYPVVNEYISSYFQMEILKTKVYDNENENSIVLKIGVQNFSFLMMGDAGIQKEKDILDMYNLNDIDFLKVGHHGSNTSSSEYFIDKIKPKYAFISVGRNNRYGHPKKSVLDTLSNSKVYRTDKDGSIKIMLNKHGYRIRTCVS